MLGLAIVAALPLSGWSDTCDGGKCVNPNPVMASGRLKGEEIQEIFWIMLTHTGYDNNLDDQAPWGKPRREATTLQFVPNLMTRAGTPIGSLSANTGLNTAKYNPPGGPGASHIFADETALLEACQSRSQLAFLMGHEMAHLVHHDPEKLEKFLTDRIGKWFDDKGNEMVAFGATSNAIKDAMNHDIAPDREAFVKAFEAEADLTGEQWTGETTDPKTGQRFSAGAGREALDAIKKWIDAKDIKYTDTQHAPLVERIFALELAAANKKK